MRIKRVIELYKQNLHDSIYNMKEFTMVGCNSPGDKFKCSCVQAIEWDDLKFDNMFLTVKNGYKFRLSTDLGNELERMWLPLIQPERLNQDWTQRNAKRRKFHYDE